MPEENTEKTRLPRGLKMMAFLVGAFLVITAGYVFFQIVQVAFPQNTYEIALSASISDTIDAEGVLLFDESYVSGSGVLGYLVEDGERVSAGTAVAEVYRDSSQVPLRQQLNQLAEQIDLLQKSQNTSSVQIDSLVKERSSAIYNLLDALDEQEYNEIDTCADGYLLAQNKLWIVAGEAIDFTDQITSIAQQMQSIQAQLGTPSQITASQTGYFVRSASSARLNASAEDILKLSAPEFKAYAESNPIVTLDDCAGKVVTGFTWQYVGVCSAKQGEKLLNENGKPLSSSVTISFPGQMESELKAKVADVTIDEENDLAKFVLTCNTINGDVLRLNCASARISLGSSTGLRVPISAVHYLKEDGTEAEQEGENYIPGVYVKYGNIASFRKIDPVDADHPLIVDGEYILVSPKGTQNSVSEVQLYDEIIVSGKNLYDGKLL